jgi:hypothetical protein
VFYRLADGVTVPNFLVTKSDNLASIIILTAILPERHAELRCLRAKFTRDILQIDEGVLGDILRPKEKGRGKEGWGKWKWIALFRYAVLAWLAHKTSILYHKCKENELRMD